MKTRHGVASFTWKITMEGQRQERSEVVVGPDIETVYAAAQRVAKDEKCVLVGVTRTQPVVIVESRP